MELTYCPFGRKLKMNRPEYTAQQHPQVYAFSLRLIQTNIKVRIHTPKLQIHNTNKIDDKDSINPDFSVTNFQKIVFLGFYSTNKSHFS